MSARDETMPLFTKNFAGVGRPSGHLLRGSGGRDGAAGPAPPGAAAPGADRRIVAHRRDRRQAVAGCDPGRPDAGRPLVRAATRPGGAPGGNGAAYHRRMLLVDRRRQHQPAAGRRPRRRPRDHAASGDRRRRDARRAGDPAARGSSASTGFASPRLGPIALASTVPAVVGAVEEVAARLTIPCLVRLGGDRADARARRAPRRRGAGPPRQRLRGRPPLRDAGDRRRLRDGHDARRRRPRGRLRRRGDRAGARSWASRRSPPGRRGCRASSRASPTARSGATPSPRSGSGPCSATGP